MTWKVAIEGERSDHEDDVEAEILSGQALVSRRHEHEWKKTGFVREGLTDAMLTYECVRCGAYGDDYLVGLGDERDDAGVCA